MKKRRTLCFALALLLVLTMFATTSLVDPESEVRAASEYEEAVSETGTVEDMVEIPQEETAGIDLEQTEAPVELTAEPAEEPTEPVAEPAGQPEAVVEESAGQSTVSVAEPSTAPEGPAMDPAGETEPSAEPAQPAATPEPAEKAYYTVKLDYNGFRGEDKTAAEVTCEENGEFGSDVVPDVNYPEKDDPAEIQELLDAKEYAKVKEVMDKWWQENAFDGFYFDGWYTEAEEGRRVAYDTKITADVTYYAHWHKADEAADDEADDDEAAAGVPLMASLEEPEPIANTDTPTQEITDESQGVWLHVVNGSFTGKYKVGDAGTETDISGQPSVWVKFEGDTRKLPADLPQVVRGHGEFDAWYTKAPSEKIVNDDSNEFGYWSTVKTNGEKLSAGDEVPANVNVLYAAFTDASSVEENDKLITYYYDYNGMKDMYGHCITSISAYKNNPKFTAEKAAVYNFNYDGSLKDDVNWDNLQKLWNEKTFGGYKFLGWSTEEKGNSLITEDTTIKNGMTFYAHWEKGTESHDDYVKEDFSNVGPVDSIRIDGSLNRNVHAQKGASIQFDLACTPVKAMPNNLTWTLEFTDGTLAGVFKPISKTVTVNEPYNDESDTEKTGFMAKAVGKSLIITNLDGQTHGIRVRAAEQTAEGLVSTPADAVAGFEHNVSEWKVTVEATCSVEGQESGRCTVCGEEVTRKVSKLAHCFEFVVKKAATCTEDGLKEKECLLCGATYGEYLAELIPATGHTYKVVKKTVDKGVPIYTEECIHKDDEKTVMCGDTTGDGYLSAVDVSYLYKIVSGQVDVPLDTVVGDVTNDGYVSAVDVSYLYKYVSGQIDSIE